MNQNLSDAQDVRGASGKRIRMARRIENGTGAMGGITVGRSF